MTDPDPTTFYDGDGHVVEDVAALIQHLPTQYRQAMERIRRRLPDGADFQVFPALSHFHAIPISVPALSETVELTPEGWLSFLDAIGIQRTVLYPTLGLSVGRIRDLNWLVAVSRAYNDWLAETYLSHPSRRFAAVALLPMLEPEHAARELHRAVTQLGFCGGMLPGNGLPNQLGSHVYYPLYRKAAELGVPLAIHGGRAEGYGFDDFNMFAPAQALGFPFSLLIALGGLLFGGAFQTFPDLRMAFLEGGVSWVLLAAERFSESYHNVKPIESAGVLNLPEGFEVVDYLRQLMEEGRIVVGCEGGEEQLEYAIDYLRCCPFMYSSDFPHEVSTESCKRELAELVALKISDSAQRAVLGETARVFYGL
jgi:predicted TIM-barrel fold metal-dependent hydrolase